MPKGNNTEIRHRVIVVGAGFSGLVAARELEAAGVDVSIYEASEPHRWEGLDRPQNGL